jgi:hypothetical protein
LFITKIKTDTYTLLLVIIINWSYKKNTVMKKPLSISLALLILLSSCATFNQSKFKNKTNHKDLIISKYGPSDLVKVEDGLETWVYDNSSFIKSNRRVVFNNENRIISNKKTLSPVAYVFNWTLWTLATVALVFVVTGGSPMVY